MDVLAWLLDSDPAIRWQVLRDLADAPGAETAAERDRVAGHGWGARLLALQGTDGQWDGGTYWPAHDDDPVGQPWTATTYSLLLLREFGINPDHLRAGGAAGIRTCHRRDARIEGGAYERRGISPVPLSLPAASGGASAP